MSLVMRLFESWEGIIWNLAIWWLLVMVRVNLVEWVGVEVWLNLMKGKRRWENGYKIVDNLVKKFCYKREERNVVIF